MKTKKIVFLLVLIIIVISLGIVLGVSKRKNTSNAKHKIVVSNFASYDFVRAIIGNNKDFEITFLIGPGKDAHSYDPTAGDLIKIQNSDLFIYVGGEMEKWSDKVLDSLETKGTQTICIADFVEIIEEKEIDRSRGA